MGGPSFMGRSCGTIIRCEPNLMLRSFLGGYEFQIFRAGVVGGWADDLSILALLDNMGRPARGACDDEQRRKKIDGDAHLMIGDGGVPVEVGEHSLGVHHYTLDALGD